MGYLKYVTDLWRKRAYDTDEFSARIMEWRQSNATVRVDKPTRIDRARALGYKAKQGFVIIRQRVPRGGHRRPKPGAGRRPKRYGTRLNLSKNYQQIAEERAQKKFLNLTVLNSYWAAEDGKFYWYEVIMVDPHHPVIKADKNLQWLQTKKNQTRVFQGKTSAGRKGRGIR